MSYVSEWQAYMHLHGEEAANPESLGASMNQRVYLQNRLHVAFDAGYAAGLKLAEQSVMERLQKLLFDSHG